MASTAFPANGLVIELIESAISISSAQRLVRASLKLFSFSAQIGLKTSSETINVFYSMPTTYLRALSKSDAGAPKSSEVLPVIMVPSGITMAPASFPVSSALCKQAA